MLHRFFRENRTAASRNHGCFRVDLPEHLILNRKKCIDTLLDVSCEEIIRRVNNISTRGIAMKPGKTLADLYEERKPYYEKYAQLTIPCDGKTMEQCVQAIALAVDNPVRMC